jgi:hypothetical protein
MSIVINLKCRKRGQNVMITLATNSFQQGFCLPVWLVDVIDYLFFKIILLMGDAGFFIQCPSCKPLFRGLKNIWFGEF